MKLAQSDILRTGKEIKCEQQTIDQHKKSMYWYQNESNKTEESTRTNFFFKSTQVLSCDHLISLQI